MKNQKNHTDQLIALAHTHPEAGCIDGLIHCCIKDLLKATQRYTGPVSERDIIDHVRTYHKVSAIEVMRVLTYMQTDEAMTTDAKWCDTVCSASHRPIHETSGPLIHACRLWLGVDGNAHREVSATTLYLELQELCATNNLKFSYRSAAAFGKSLTANFAALQILGLEKRRTNTGRSYTFNPTENELEKCIHLHRDNPPTTATEEAA
jgi:hypothetical protein